MGLLVWALTAALMGLAALPCSVAAAAAVPLPFPLPDRVVRGQDSAPLVIWPRAFRMLDASDQPTRTVALALERYWVRAPSSWF